MPGESVAMHLEGARDVAGLLGRAAARLTGLAAQADGIAAELELRSVGGSLRGVATWARATATDITWRLETLQALDPIPSLGFLRAEFSFADRAAFLAQQAAGAALGARVDALYSGRGREGDDAFSLADALTAHAADPVFLAAALERMGPERLAWLLVLLTPPDLYVLSFIGPWPPARWGEDLARFDAVVGAIATATHDGPWLPPGFGAELAEACTASDGLIVVSLVARLGGTQPLDDGFRTAAARAALAASAGVAPSIVAPQIAHIFVDLARDPDLAAAELCSTDVAELLAGADHETAPAIAALLGAVTLDRSWLAGSPTGRGIAEQVFGAFESLASVDPGLRAYLAELFVAHLDDVAEATVRGNSAVSGLLTIDGSHLPAIITAAAEGDAPGAPTDRLLLGTQAWTGEVFGAAFDLHDPTVADRRSVAAARVGTVLGLVIDNCVTADMNDAQRADAERAARVSLLAGVADLALNRLPGGPLVGMAVDRVRNAVVDAMQSNEVGVTFSRLQAQEAAVEDGLTDLVAITFYESARDALADPAGVDPDTLASAGQSVAGIVAFNDALPPSQRFLTPTGTLRADLADPASADRLAAFRAAALDPAPGQAVGAAGDIRRLAADLQAALLTERNSTG